MSFNPQTGLAYIPVLEKGWVHSPDNFYLFDQAPHIDELRQGQPQVDEGGYLRAWDPVRQALIWQVENSTLINGGTLTTAGNLVFQGTQDGYLNAYNARTGERLLHLFLGPGILAPPETYAVKGEPYIVVLAGFGGATLFMIEETAAANKYSNAGRLLAFRLNGGPVPLPEEKARFAAESMAETQVASEQLERGRNLYTRYCGFCHGMFGSKSILPDLMEMRPEVNAIFRQIVLDGVFAGKGMAGFADVLSAEEVEQIRCFLVSRNNSRQ